MVKIRMKSMGRKHRPFFRICAIDSRSPRDGRAIEELGTYDPMIAETDKRYVINKDRVQYWIGVGAQPSERVWVLLKKIGIAPRVKPKPKRKPARGTETAKKG